MRGRIGTHPDASPAAADDDDQDRDNFTQRELRSVEVEGDQTTPSRRRDALRISGSHLLRNIELDAGERISWIL